MKNVDKSLKLELIMLIILLISCIISFITKNFIYTEFIAGINLIIMGYNNQKHFKRKYMTYINSAMGIILIIMSICNLING